MWTKYLPTLDLHGFISSEAELLINQFIFEQYSLQTKRVVIIHGHGTGILKQVVNKVLAKNKLVKEYQTSIFNPGCTIVEIKD